jgi:hypothetical protein
MFCDFTKLSCLQVGKKKTPFFVTSPPIKVLLVVGKLLNALSMGVSLSGSFLVICSSIIATLFGSVGEP